MVKSRPDGRALRSPEFCEKELTPFETDIMECQRPARRYEKRL